MIKTVLVPAPGDGSDPGCLAAALSIARAFAAHIDVLHVRTDPVQLALSMTSEPGGVVLIEQLVAQLEQDAAQYEAAAQQMFEDFCAREKVAVLDTPTAGPAIASVQSHVETGDDAGTIAAFGRAADLIVTGRGINHDVTKRSILESVLFETGRPLSIPSRRASSDIVGGTVAIGWKDTPQTARAVAAAMPLLARAKEIGDDDGREGGCEESADRLLRNLAWHGLCANRRLLRPAGEDAAETLLSAATEQAGLLVMGGYGHSRVREWVFGGFTQRVIEDAPLPVLLAH